MKRGRALARLKQFFNFEEENYAFGTAMSGKLKKDLYLFIVSVAIGFFFAVVTGFPGASPVYTAFLKDYLGVNNTLYAVFIALPYLLAFLQIPFAGFLQKHMHVKKYFIIFSYLARLNFALIGILSYFYRGEQSLLIALLLVIQAFTSVFWWTSDLCFSVWIGAACPPNVSGRFFSTRQMVFTIAQLVYSSILAVILQALQGNRAQYLILFVAAAIFGCLDISLFLFIREPRAKAQDRADLIAGETEQVASELQQASGEAEQNTASTAASTDASTAKSISLPLRDPSYRNFLIFSTLWNFGLFLVSPYTNVYMLETLHIPTSRQTLYATFLPSIATILFVRLNGHMSDRYGHRNTLLLMSLLSAVHPFIWLLVAPQTEALIGVLNFFWGISGIAVDLSIYSMGIYLAPEEHRTSYVSVKTVAINLLGIAPAILISGLLMDRLSPVMTRAAIPYLFGGTLQPFHIVLIFSGVLRFASIFLFARKITRDNEKSFGEFIRELWSGITVRFKIRTGLFNKRRK